MTQNNDVRPSELGTKEYWDNVYEREITNFDEFGDEGEVWFGEECVDKMVAWTLKNVPPTSSSSTRRTPPNILEIGSGNGNLLFALADAGYDTSYLAGIDYSADAVKLGRKIASEKGGEYENIVFEEADILSAEYAENGGRVVLKGIPKVRVDREKEQCLEEEGGEGWKLVLDKGTYDAMALAGYDEEGRRSCDVYPTRVAAFLKHGGFFLITSCNFTKEELLRTFQSSETGLVYHSEIEFPSISFGGIKGSTYCSVAFQKNTKATQ